MATLPKNIWVTERKEFWRRRYAQQNSMKYALRMWVTGRMHHATSMAYGLWKSTAHVECRGRDILVYRLRKSAVELKDVRGHRWRPQLAARLLGDYIVMNPKAPRWMLNWAKEMPNCVVLPRLTKKALQAHLVVQRLRGEL